MHEDFTDGDDRVRPRHRGERGRAKEPTDPVDLACLLRAQYERPVRDCAAENRDKFAAPHGRLLWRTTNYHILQHSKIGGRCRRWVKTRIRLIRAYVSFHRLRTLV